VRSLPLEIEDVEPREFPAGWTLLEKRNDDDGGLFYGRHMNGLFTVRGYLAYGNAAFVPENMRPDKNPFEYGPVTSLHEGALMETVIRIEDGWLTWRPVG
jgi:hypothetical protein